MPYVSIRVTREGVSPQQKARLVEGVTRLLADVLGKDPMTTMVVVDEVELENWGIGGELVRERRERARRAGGETQR